jgi:hypothetical protein
MVFWFILVLSVFWGCSGAVMEKASQTTTPSPPGQLVDASGQVGVYVYRNANFSGGGRVHLLQIDELTLGPLTDSNYYHIYLWPGRYHLNIHLPAEDFFGRSKPAMNKSMRLVLPKRFAGRAIIYEFTDGKSFRKLESRAADVTAVTGKRSLAKFLKAEKTAQVTEFLDTRYEGPSLYGKPHGRGDLIWDDGCRYKGVFDYGQLTPEGKFYFADGRMYMGQLNKGRPKGRGILLSSEGLVLYAGFFEEEVPHGRGIRHGPHGPEYCIYEHGKDITKPIRQLADEAVSAEEKALETRIKEQETTAAVESPHVPEEAAPHTDTTDMQDENGVEDQAAEDAPEEPDYRKQLEHMRRIRDWRMIVMRRTIAAGHQAGLDQEKAWCDDELADGRDWCICAPFVPDAGQWKSCMR